VCVVSQCGDVDGVSLLVKQISTYSTVEKRHHGLHVAKSLRPTQPLTLSEMGNARRQ